MLIIALVRSVNYRKKRNRDIQVRRSIKKGVLKGLFNRLSVKHKCKRFRDYMLRNDRKSDMFKTQGGW